MVPVIERVHCTLFTVLICMHLSQNETEWQSFLRQSLEFVGKVSELFPSAAFQVILPLLENYSQVYFSLQQLITPGEQGKGTCTHVT